MPEETVATLERALGSFGVAGQLQQHPSPRGGGIVTRDNFRFYKGAAPSAEGFDLNVISVDAAFKDTKLSSYVVIQMWGRSPPNNYLLAQMRDRMSFIKTLAAIRKMRDSFERTNVIMIEDKANGPAIIDVLRKSIPGVIPEEPHGSKMARAEATAPLIEAGNVWVPDPDEQPWVESFISEWCAIPTNAFWDQVDAASQYLNKYGGAVLRGSVGESFVVGGAAENSEGAAAFSSDSPWGSGGGSSDSPWSS